MKKNIFIVLAAILMAACSISKKDELQKSLEEFRKDSAMQSLIYSNIDTIDGFWRIKISKEEAIKRGVDADIYALFEKSIKEVNMHIDSIKKRGTDTHIEYHFPEVINHQKEK